MYYIGVTEEKVENLKKRRQNEDEYLNFHLQIHFEYLKVYAKFENTGSNRSREICDRNFHWRERKLTK